MNTLPSIESPSSKLVSIGLPVFNGEDYLEATLDALLNQSYTNFELIISDNASTDRTRAICEAYALRDTRICYHRQANNQGAIWNFTFTFHQAKGDYFMWASAHDLWHDNFIEACKEILDLDSSVVLVYPFAYLINTDGETIAPMLHKLDTRGRKRALRTRIIIQDISSGNMFHGLFRRAVLQKCRLDIRSLGADLVILMEVGLHGSIAQIPQKLFYRREFRKKVTIKEQLESQLERIDPLKKRHKFVYWEMGKEYIISTLHARIPFWEKPYILLNVLFSFWYRWKSYLINDLNS